MTYWLIFGDRYTLMDAERWKGPFFSVNAAQSSVDDTIDCAVILDAVQMPANGQSIDYTAFVSSYDRQSGWKSVHITDGMTLDEIRAELWG